MMTKQEHIDFWKNTADENWDTALYNYQGKQYVMTLFMFDLVIEKLIKAHWVKDNISNTPPRSHDLKFLVSETELELNSKHYDLLSIVTDWNISTRYPDYKLKLHKIANETYMQEQLHNIEELRRCLLEKL